MALYADRVKDSTSITGTGAITLSGTAPTGYQTFATAFGSTALTVAYCIADQTGANWEVGTGVFNGTTGLTRVTVLGSSNAGALVSFTGGTQDVFCTAPARYLQLLDAGNITGLTLSTGATSPTLTVQTGAPTATQNGGALTVKTPNATAATKAAGGITIQAGNGLTSGLGGSVSLVAGNTPLNYTGGSISASAGTGSSGGNVTFNAGLGYIAGGGSITFNGGGSNNSTGGGAGLVGGTGVIGGGVTFLSGSSLAGGNGAQMLAQGGTNTGAGGNMSFSGGDAGFGTDANGGGISFNSGLADGVGTNGGVAFNTGGGQAIRCDDSGTPSYNTQIGFYGVTPVAQPTTATASATRAAVIGTVANVGDTYDNYTLAQVVKALRNLGILA